MASYDSGIFYDSAVYFDGFVPPQPKTNRMKKVKIGADKMNPDQLVTNATAIKTAMTGNANFTTPHPDLTAVGTKINTLQTKITAYNNAVTASDTALADRDVAAADLRATLVQLAAYVDNICAGDAVKIASSGFGVRNTPAPIGPLPQVDNAKVEANPNDGSLDVSWDGVRGAVSYEVQISVDPVTSTSWTHALTAGKTSATLTDLTSGTRQWARIRAIGANNNTGPWSDPAVKTVP